MADWDEVKRLAADFQKVQLSTSSQSLSERNCIEIVTLLMKKKLIDLIFTTDGKEYITPSQLVEDIKAELYVNGGRINLVDLARTLGVDLAHVTSHLNEVLKGHKEIHSVMGQLVDNTYIARIATEINEKLSQQGQINISDLTIQYDLPAEFLQQQVVEKNLGKLIQGKQDDNDQRVFFTESFVAKCKAKIRGALAGLTKPTSVSAILNQIEVSEKLFFSLFSQVCTYGTLTSRLAGAQYIPNVYSRSQNEWVTSFFKQNGYLEFDTLRQLGITDYKSYLKKQLASDDIIMLNSLIISQRIIDRLEDDIDECIASKSYIDLQNNLPSVFNDTDIEQILKLVLAGHKQQHTLAIEDYVLSKNFIDELSKSCDELVEEKAKHLVQTGKYQQFQTDWQISSMKLHRFESESVDLKTDKREERRKKAAGGKAGGGTQGRETKTKSVKKLYRTGKQAEEPEEVVTEKKGVLEVVSDKDIKTIIENKLEEEGLSILLEPLAGYLQSELNEKGLKLAATLYAASVSDRTANRRQTHNDLQNKLNLLVTDVRLFEKGIKLLPSDLQTQLYKYLLKTLCTDIVNEVLNYLGSEQGLNTTCDNYTNEQRVKFINALSVENKNSLLLFVKSLSTQNVDEFFANVEDALSVCSMILKKIDKKKDRVTILNHKHGLLEQLQVSEDPAIILHLTTLIIFITATQNILHASGKHVTALLAVLKQYLSAEQITELNVFHDLVTSMLCGGPDVENIKYQLKEKIPHIKKLAEEYKKTNSDKC